MEIKSASSIVPVEQASLKKKMTAHDDGNTSLEAKSEMMKEQIQQEIKSVREENKTKDDLLKQVDNMNEFLAMNTTSLKFNFHEKLDRYYVQVVNKETDEVVREIPPEEFLDMVSSMMEHLGFIVDKRV
ncbi:flagellar protein FlaG [Anaerobacillus sp. MEB173]|uniref:flagellar protein FlaG n=1 Tax=Anaerobacillus sp. MEB173 TaxID=3383345 RepID=UPI003F8EBC2A